MAVGVGEAPGLGLAGVLELILTSPTRWSTMHASVVGSTIKREVSREVWLAQGGRVRCEESQAGHDTVTTVVQDGRKWWTLDPDEGLTIGDNDPPPVPWAPSTNIDSLLGNLGWFDLGVTGEAERGARPCLLLRATRRPTPGWSVGPSHMTGDHHRIAVDRDRGVILFMESRRGEEIVAVDDVIDIVFDEHLPDDLFGDPPAGYDDRALTSRQRLHDKFVSLTDASASAPFTLLVPERLPNEGCLLPVFLGRRRNDTAVSAILSYDLQHLRFLTLHQAAGGPGATALADTACWERVERTGRTLYLCEPTEPTARSNRQVFTEQGGTQVLLSLSREFDRSELLDVVDSLVPVSTITKGVDP